MNVFEILKAEHHRIEQQLDEFVASYDQMSNAKRFERSSLIFDEIKRHFVHQETVLSHISSEKDAECLEECLRDRKNIIAAMDNLLMSHVDDADFREGLRVLLARFDEHLKHSEDKLFANFRQQLSAQELRNLDERAADWMLGSTFGSRF